MIGVATGAPITSYQDDAHQHTFQLNMSTNTWADCCWVAFCNEEVKQWRHGRKTFTRHWTVQSDTERFFCSGHCHFRKLNNKSSFWWFWPSGHKSKHTAQHCFHNYVLTDTFLQCHYHLEDSLDCKHPPISSFHVSCSSILDSGLDLLTESFITDLTTASRIHHSHTENRHFLKTDNYDLGTPPISNQKAELSFGSPRPPTLWATSAEFQDERSHHPDNRENKTFLQPWAMGLCDRELASKPRSKGRKDFFTSFVRGIDFSFSFLPLKHWLQEFWRGRKSAALLFGEA